jgi:hypothetical protein
MLTWLATLVGCLKHRKIFVAVTTALIARISGW